MKYDVHAYCVVRVKVKDIEADSQEQAITRATNSVSFNLILDQAGDPEEPIRSVEFDDDFVGYLVDERGDEQFEKSRFYVDAHHAKVHKTELETYAKYEYVEKTSEAGKS